jgi:cell division protein FtsI/penicillin-binding protein 2
MKAQVLSGRAGLVFVVCLVATGGLLFSLFQKQVLEHQELAQAAESQSVDTSSQPAERGKIFMTDRDGKLYALAASVWRYNLLISPRQVKDKKKLVETLKQDLPDLNTTAVLATISTDKIYVPPVVKGVSAEAAEKIAAKKLGGVLLQPVLARVYPEGPSMAPHVAGFVGADSAGKYGVEAFYNDVLAGRSGEEQAKRDSLGRLIDILGQEQPEAGQDVVLTLDYNLQYTVEKELKTAIETYQADRGSIIVMDPKTGAILAVAGTPGFDPNDTSSITGETLGNLLMPAASNVYESGSVVKPITMAAGIDAGVVTPETTNTFGLSVNVAGHEIFNAKKEAFGKETMTQVLENSDNIAMVWIAGLLGGEKERTYFDKFGLGRKSGLDLIGEQTGRLASQKDWNPLLQATSSFGQGISMTVLQLAAAYSVIGNGGTLVAPHLAAKTIHGKEETVLSFPVRGTGVISADAASKVRQMLVSVVENGHGKRAKVEGVKVGGKTGTAQIPDDKGGYFEDKHNGTFAGMFPADDPKFVMVVRLDNPKTVNFAESSAAPTFGAIANWMANYYQLR